MNITKAVIAVLFAGLTSLSFAGPGPQFWDQQTRNAKSRIPAEAKARTDAPKPATLLAASCATCSCCAKKS
jgi:hypothetical protein